MEYEKKKECENSVMWKIANVEEECCWITKLKNMATEKKEQA